MAKAEITVAVEKVVHKALSDLAKSIWDKHEMCVNSVSFSWVDVSTPGKTRFILTDNDYSFM